MDLGGAREGFSIARNELEKFSRSDTPKSSHPPSHMTYTELENWGSGNGNGKGKGGPYSAANYSTKRLRLRSFQRTPSIRPPQTRFKLNKHTDLSPIHLHQDFMP